MSPFATLVAIFAEPAKAMEAVRARSMVWLPLLLLVLGNIAMMLWYYQVVDFAWLQDHILNADPNTTAEQREMARGFMTRGVMLGSTVGSMALMIPLMLALLAVYYLLAAKVIGNDLGYGKWFAFATWSAVPSLLVLPAMAVQLLLNDNGQIGPEALNPLSLNQLLFHLPVSDPWAGLLNALGLTTLWSIAVAVIGMRVWTGKSIGTSAVVVLLPQVVVFGAWALFIALRSGA